MIALQALDIPVSHGLLKGDWTSVTDISVYFSFSLCRGSREGASEVVQHL